VALAAQVVPAVPVAQALQEPLPVAQVWSAQVLLEP
jgi:hypothetical protein